MVVDIHTTLSNNSQPLVSHRIMGTQLQKRLDPIHLLKRSDHS